MSKYGWERGSVIVPTKEWAGFRKKLRESYNSALAKDFLTVQSIFEAVKVANKGKRGVNWTKAVEEEVYKEIPSGSYRYAGTPKHTLLVISEWSVVQAITTKDAATGFVKLATPKAKSFPPAKSDAKEYRCGEAGITLDLEKRKASWHVPDNNHAVESAHEHHMGKVFFAALNAITWTRGSGGAFYGSDEYFREANEEPGGSSTYITSRYGPIGDQVYEQTTGFKPAKSRTGSLPRRW